MLALGLTMLPFVPCSNLFFLVGTTVAERLLYPSTAGWALLAASVGAVLSRRTRANGTPLRRSGQVRIAIALLLLLFCGFYGCCAGMRMWQWRNRVELFKADMATWHRSAKVVHQYASLLHGGGRLEEAARFYRRSLDIFDDNALTDYCIAKIQLQLGHYNESLATFEKIMAGHGIGFGRHNTFLLSIDFGWLLTRLGRYAEAIPLLTEGVRLRPSAAYAWNALGVATANGAKYPSDLQQAIEHILKAIELQPRSGAIWSNAAAIASAGGAHEQATMAAQNALALAPEEEGARWNARVLLEGAKGQPRLELFLDSA